MTKEEHHRAIDRIMAIARELKLKADREIAELDKARRSCKTHNGKI